MIKTARCILLIIALIAIIIILITSPNIAKNHEGVSEILLEELQLTESNAYSVTFAGEFTKGDDALLWYIIESPTDKKYTIAECTLLPGNHYYFKEMLTPETYSKDIVCLMWNKERIYLINDIRCRAIVFRNRNGEITSRITLSPTDLPYLYHHTNDTAKTYSFLDEFGNSLM